MDKKETRHQRWARISKEIEKVFEKALDDGLTKVDVKEIIEIVLGERDYGNKAK